LDIALVNNDYPPFIFGGIGNFIFELAKGLSRKGVNVHIITGYSEPLNSIGTNRFQRYTEHNIDVLRYPYPSIAPRHTFFQIWNYKRIINTLQKLDVDLVHGQSGSTYPLVRRLVKDTPVLTTFHGSALSDRTASVQSIFQGGTLDDFSKFFLGYPAWHFSYKKELKYSTAAVAVSKTLKSELIKEMGHEFSQKIRCIYNGVDIKSLDKQYNSINTGDVESDEVILFAGRLYWRKGAINVLKIAHLLQKKGSKFTIRVHGTGPLYDKMQGYIKSHSLKNITLYGFTPKDQLLASMKKCKYVLIPSLYEACPMTLLECMCLGKIPLMLKLPFSDELSQQGKYGVLGNGVENLTDRLIALKATNSVDEFSKQIQRYARENFNMDNIAGTYLEAYRDLCR
jgi:glycosyltransferase involved in cell wall biosynthesis